MLPPGAIADCAAALACAVQSGSSSADALDELAAASRFTVAQRFRHAARLGREGKTLPEALAAAGFPGDLTALVEACRSPSALAELLHQIEADQRLTERIRRAWRRLAVMLTAGAVIAACALTAVFSFTGLGGAFSQFYTETGWPIPKLSSVVFWITDRPVLMFLLVLGSPLFVALLILGLLRFPPTARLAYKIPFWGRVLKMRDLSQACFVLAHCTQAGVPANQAAAQTIRAVRNIRMKSAFARVVKELEDGTRLSDALVIDSVFPRTLVWAVRLGESSGDLSRLLATLAEIYGRECRRESEASQGLIAPLWVAVFGTVVCVWVFSLLIPLVWILKGLGNLRG